MGGNYLSVEFHLSNNRGVQRRRVRAERLSPQAGKRAQRTKAESSSPFCCCLLGWVTQAAAGVSISLNKPERKNDFRHQQLILPEKKLRSVFSLLWCSLMGILSIFAVPLELNVQVTA